MSDRQERGLEIAAKYKVFKKDDGTWSVPSQAGNGRYAIHMGEYPTCSCLDYETRACKCKHIFAVEYVLEHGLDAEGRETITETLTVKRKTYPQNWTAYNTAQTTEKAEFQHLLYDLCAGVETPEQTKGRPRIPLADALFSVAFKVYSTVSGRRFISDLNDARGKGYIEKVPHFNSIFNYLEMPGLTPVLTDLITKSSLPLAAVESDFAVDSTGFGSCRFVTWFNTKYGETQDKHDWVKAHICCGVKTNVVTAIRVTDRFVHDSPVLPELIETTARNFQMAEVSADKGYSSRKNLGLIVATGATPYLAFKKSSKPDRTESRLHTVQNTLWTRMFHFYSYNRDEFMQHYHKRSNVESTFMAIKAKFGDGVRSKTYISQTNEVLCKVLCHNICCIISSIHEMGIEPEFGRVV
jgi:transposase